MTSRHLAVVLAVAAAAPLAAQGTLVGTATFHMTMHVTAGTPGGAALPPGTEMEAEMTYATDGRHFVMQNVMNSSSVPMMSGMMTRMIFTVGSDSIHMGIVMPPEIAAQTGSIGTKMDLSMAQLTAAGKPAAALMDSVVRANAGRTYRALGTTATVAGITCQEWESIAAGDTTRSCVIPTPPALAAMQEQFKTFQSAAILSNMPGLDAMQKQAYGGQAVTPIRTTSTRTGMVLELTKYSATAPDPAMMQLPAGLTVMAMPGGG